MPIPAGSLLRVLAIAAAAGLALGGLTLVGQGLLPGATNHLANSGAVWSAGAFGVAAALTARAAAGAAAGTVALVGAVVGYYASATVFLDQPISRVALVGPLVWIVVALVAGPIFGAAGAIWRGPRPGRRVVAAAALGAVFLVEAGYLLLILDYRAQAAILTAIGLALPPLLGRNWRDRGLGLLALVPAMLLGAVAYLGIFLLTEYAFHLEL